MTKGRIIKQTGGFYYVDTGDSIVECRGRGLFRKEGITPLVGDMAEIENGFVTKLLERKNSLVRPTVANVDILFLILSIADPPPNLTVVDRLLAVAEYKDIDVVIVVTKADLADTSKLVETYEQAGYKCFSINSLADSPSEITSLIEGKLCVFAGNTGAGKSTLLNAIAPQLDLKTGETSKKLGRGKHTTRVTELFEICGGFIADTPGFSSLETIMLQRIRKEELELCFREFSPYLGECQFTGCSHTKEKGCSVLEAVKEGKISKSRHDAYCEMYEEAKQIKDWEIK